ncbi:MAG: glutaminyl-peptide cyclotransferase [Candidatus Atribacteria bacterium]|nr:glutaminyl-peptide cyclotransferase [Candidatus Atribacteria bacterium]
MNNFIFSDKIIPKILVITVWLFPIFTGTEAQCDDLLTSYFSQERHIPCHQAQVVAIYPHDPQAFTEGLIYDNGFLYESTGLYGESSLRKIDLNIGEVVRLVELRDQYFGEGLALVGSTLIQLTWKEKIALLYDKNTLELKKTVYYPYEGWGITYDGNHLIVSDGSNLLRFLDPRDFSLMKELPVSLGGKSIDQLNELEYINGKIYANVWYTNIIVIIDPRNGEVVGWIDLALIEEKRNTGENVPNGIAYDTENNRLFITGKRWSHIYEIQTPDQ